MYTALDEGYSNECDCADLEKTSCCRGRLLAVTDPRTMILFE
jgi:hypothetical protein